MSRPPHRKQSTHTGHSAVSGRNRKTVPQSRAPDRRVERTRRLLHQAIVELIQERGWDAITVQDVCERADVGRSTFYVHFADKEELLIAGFAELRKHLREIAVADPSKPLAFTRALLEHTHEYKPVYRALLGGRTAQVVYRAWIETCNGPSGRRSGEARIPWTAAGRCRSIPRGRDVGVAQLVERAAQTSVDRRSRRNLSTADDGGRARSSPAARELPAVGG